MNKNSFALSITLFFSICLSAFPKTFVVSNTNKLAKDTNPGTMKFPFLTIQKGINMAQAGDTVLVLPGIYSENLVIKRSGNEQAGCIVLKSYKQYSAVIDGSNIQNDKLIYWHGNSDGGKNKDYIKLDGFEIRNAKKWAFWIQGDYNILENLRIHDTGKTAVQLITGSHNKFINNEIYNTGWNGISWEANNGGSGIRTDSNLVEHNFIHNLKYHVAINGFPNEDGGNSVEYGGNGNMIMNNVIKDCLEGIYLRYERNFLIAGNLLDHINKDGIFLHYDSSDRSAYLGNGKIINNTIANIGYNGISNANVKNVEIINNIFYNYGDSVNSHKYYSFAIYWYPITYSDGNIMNANIYFNNNGNPNLVYLYYGNKTLKELEVFGFENKGMQTNPEFTNPVSGDYTLKASSPAIGGGINIKELNGMKDINLILRSQGRNIDIGAFEFN
jgi:parallel beta-helix repeat protein